jgi:hypothetical protein
MLTFPLVSGLVMGGPSWGGVAVAALSVVGFLAHESVLIVSGARGERIRSREAARARSTLVRLGVVAVVAAGAFVATASAYAWRAALLSGALAVVVGALLVVGKTKSLAGELLVAVTFSSVHAALAAAAGSPATTTFLPVAVWALCFFLATLSVHAMKYRFKGRGPGRWTTVAAPVLAGVVTVVGALKLASPRPVDAVAVASLPKAVAVLVLSVLPANPRHLKRVGWTFVLADALTLGILVWRLG